MWTQSWINRYQDVESHNFKTFTVKLLFLVLWPKKGFTCLSCVFLGKHSYRLQTFYFIHISYFSLLTQIVKEWKRAILFYFLHFDWPFVCGEFLQKTDKKYPQLNQVFFFVLSKQVAEVSRVIYFQGVYFSVLTAWAVCRMTWFTPPLCSSAPPHLIVFRELPIILHTFHLPARFFLSKHIKYSQLTNVLLP